MLNPNSSIHSYIKHRKGKLFLENCTDYCYRPKNRHSCLPTLCSKLVTILLCRQQHKRPHPLQNQPSCCHIPKCKCSIWMFASFKWHLSVHTTMTFRFFTFSPVTFSSSSLMIRQGSRYRQILSNNFIQCRGRETSRKINKQASGTHALLLVQNTSSRFQIQVTEVFRINCKIASQRRGT